MDPDVWCINVCDVFGRVVEVTWVNIESQYDDTVATVVMTYQRISVSTRIFEVTWHIQSRQTEPHRVAFADGRVNDRRILYMVVYIQMIDAVINDTCHQSVFVRGIYVVIRYGEELLIVRLEIPDMRQRSVLRSTDRDRVAEDVRLMNREVQYDRTVASVLTWHRDGVFTGLTQYKGRVFCALMPCVMPNVRQLTVGDGHFLVCYRNTFVP